MANDNKLQSHWWHLPIVFVLTGGYALGGYLAFGIMFFDVFSCISNNLARFTLVLFGMGLLGSTMYCTKYWAIDLEGLFERKSPAPNPFDVFGYAFTEVGGGITGVVLYLAVKAGLMIAITAEQPVEPGLSFSLVIAFCGGLFHFKVREMLKSLLKKMTKQAND